MYLNPALTGTGECGRIMLNYRNQWPSIDNGFTTYAASGDTYIDFLSGGMGVQVLSDNAGGVVNTTRAGLTYAYHMNLSATMQLNAGFEVSYLQQRLNWDDLIFADMIDRTTGAVVPGNTIEVEPGNSTIQVADFSMGLLLGIREKYFIGVASHHLTQPDLAYYSNNGNSPLYRKYTVHAGADFVLRQGEYRSDRGMVKLQPGLLFQLQQNATQVAGGANLEIFPLTLGFWYRNNIGNTDAVAGLVGLHFRNMKFGYSYDLTLSKLSDGSGGAHEVSLAFLIGCNKKRRRPGAIKCPEF